MANHNRAVSVHQLFNTNYKELAFEDEWLAHIGKPERKGSWLIWGKSANGKTRYALQLDKYLTNFGRVAYDSLEEGASKSMRDAFDQVNMQHVQRRIVLLDKEPINELKERLRKHKSPDIIFIDSLQFTGINYLDYKRLIDEFSRKLFIWISHAEGMEPEGRTAKKVRYDAFVKIRVEGYKAFSISRYGGGEPYTIWTAGAEAYWAETSKPENYNNKK